MGAGCAVGALGGVLLGAAGAPGARWSARSWGSGRGRLALVGRRGPTGVDEFTAGGACWARAEVLTSRVSALGTTER